MSWGLASEQVLNVWLLAAQFRRGRQHGQRGQLQRAAGGGRVSWGIVPPWGALCGRLRAARDTRPHAAPALLPRGGVYCAMYTLDVHPCAYICIASSSHICSELLCHCRCASEFHVSLLCREITVQETYSSFAHRPSDCFSSGSRNADRRRINAKVTITRYQNFETYNGL